MSEDKWKPPQSLIDTRYIYKKELSPCCTKAAIEAVKELGVDLHNRTISLQALLFGNKTLIAQVTELTAENEYLELAIRDAKIKALKELREIIDGVECCEDRIDQEIAQYLMPIGDVLDFIDEQIKKLEE